MRPYCLVVDVWEGQLEIDEAVLKANGVAGMGIRLNDMNGGHHMDTNFVRQWDEAKNFVRFPYFVYNPWVDGAENFRWLTAHMPINQLSVAIDIEVRKADYPANKYAGEVVKFLALCKNQGWRTIIYTAQWFLPYLSSWPRVDYWWAQYPSPNIYLADVKTWDDLRWRLENLDIPFNAGACPGTIKMWQFSGDWLTLPGNNRRMDVNAFYGSAEEAKAYFAENGTTPVIPPAVSGDTYRVKDDLEAGIAPVGTRPYLRKGLPSTVRLHARMDGRDGKSSYNLPSAWMDYLEKINNTLSMSYLTKDGSGWHNQGDSNHFEQLTFSGNLLNVLEVIDGYGRVECYHTDEVSPSEIIKPMPGALHSRVHLFTTQYASGLDMSTDGRWPRILVMANPGETVWVDMRDVDRYAKAQITAKVRAVPWLNVRSQPTTKAPTVGRKLYGATVSITETVTSASGDAWGHCDDGWISMTWVK